MANPPILSVIGSFPQNKVFLPMAAAQTFVNGQLVGQNTGGFLVPWSASSSLLCAGLFWGPSQTSPSGADGQFGADVLQCVVQMYNGTGGDAITKAQGQPVYSADGVTALATDDGATLSIVGQCIQFNANSQIAGAVVVVVGIQESGLLSLISALSGVSLPVPVLVGGTGATTASGARTNLAAAHATAATGGTAPAFTGSVPAASLNLVTPIFSGTGYATSGQVVTTTDNQTMTLNQCAGMWFLPPSGAKPAVIILSNTAVTGAQAVLTVQGIAPTTDAGAYKIVTSLAPVGTVASHTHTQT